MDYNELITDFENEVSNRCKLINANTENVCANLRSSLELTLLSIPEVVRTMPIKQLMNEFNGNIQKATEKLSQT